MVTELLSVDTLEIEADITSIENDTSIYDEQNFDRRANAIDFVDFHILDRIESLQQNAGAIPQLELLELRAKSIKQVLEDIDTKLFKLLREDIRSGFPFKDIIHKYIDYKTIGRQPNKPGYDNADSFINSLLYCDALPDATAELDDEMVFYQQTPARVVLRLAEMAQLKPDDVFFDIGSGLGQVSILTNLLTGAKTAGIEYEPAYCDYASKCAAQLNLTNVQFLNADARNADYAIGTVFFMYTPFVGCMLQQMLDILHRQAEKRIIRIFTYGPCSPVIAKECWLKCINGDGNDIYKLYEFTNTISLLKKLPSFRIPTK